VVHDDPGRIVGQHFGLVPMESRSGGSDPRRTPNGPDGSGAAINGMVFAPGHRSSYDAWMTAGATGWGFAALLRDMSCVVTRFVTRHRAGSGVADLSAAYS
jgi:choline dehydrogenase-like flavoprotein